MPAAKTTSGATAKRTYQRKKAPASTFTPQRPSVVAEAKAELKAEKGPKTWTTSQLVLAVSVTLNVVAVVAWVA